MRLGLEEAEHCCRERGKRTFPVAYTGRATAGRGRGREDGPLNRGAGVIFDVGLCVQPLAAMGQASWN